MKISKRDAFLWYSFFAELPPGERLSVRQQEIAYAVLSQIELAVEAAQRKRLEAIPGLKTLAGRTFYVGDDARFPAGCRSCLVGTGLSAVRRTNRCNLRCPFCYDFGEMDDQPPIGEGMWEIGGTRVRAEDIDLLLSASVKPTGIAYVYLEPFMEIGLYYDIISRFASAGIHQHLYTNGTLATEENLRALGEAGLDELRFNLGASQCSDSVIGHMATARKYIPQVGVETPMTPQFYRTFLEKKDAILATGIDYINCAELHLNPNNIVNYAGEDLYCYRHGYISPVGSRLLTLELMRTAALENWPIVVHDCSDRTKFARDLNLRAREGGWFGASSYGSEFEQIPFAAFLPVLSGNLGFLEEEPLPEGYGVGELLW
ncbi:MAG: radical SAM protein [Clostridia bacterium]|nr:radical SAM protein [Clostridia bacterium]